MTGLEAPYGGFGIGVVSVLSATTGNFQKLPSDTDVRALVPELDLAFIPLRGQAGSGTLPEFGGHSIVHFAIAVDLALTGQASHQLLADIVVPASWIETEFSSDNFNVRPVGP
jgi:hypothetical protein